MGMVDLIHQVKAVLPKRFGGSGNAYGWSTSVVMPFRNNSGGTLPLGYVVQFGPGNSSGSIQKALATDSVFVVGVIVGYYTGGNTDTYVSGDVAANALAAVMVKGSCEVYLSANVSKDDYAFVHATDGTAYGSATVAAGAFGRYESTGLSGNLGRVHLFGAPVFSAGGGSSPLTTKGDIYGRSTVDARIPVGSNGQYLYADSTQTLGVKWNTISTYWQCTATFFSVAAGDEIWIRIPYDCTVDGWDITGNASGSAVVDVWSDTYTNFPPTVADTIAGSELPTLSAARKNQDTTLSTWTTSLVRGRYLMFHVNSVSGIATLQVVIYGTRTL